MTSSSASGQHLSNFGEKQPKIPPPTALSRILVALPAPPVGGLLIISLAETSLTFLTDQFPIGASLCNTLHFYLLFILQEHCLMGIKGTVRRSVDGDFIHANVDIDLIIGDEEPWGSAEKPIEIFHIIEHFCLGRRRLHVFGRDTAVRPGWLTVGPHLTSSNFNADTYSGFFNREPNSYLTGASEEIERLRPKSPPPKVKGGGVGTGGSGPSISSSVGGPPNVIPIPTGVIGASMPGAGAGMRGPPPMMAPRLAPPPRSSLPPRPPVGSGWPATLAVGVPPTFGHPSSAPLWHGQRPSFVPPHSDSYALNR